MTDATVLPTADDVERAAHGLDGIAHRTPVFTSTRLDEATGAQVFLKAESLQRVGAFKFRGAHHALSRLDAEARRRGVVAYSSGNHAQAIALAARLLGIPATVVMPHDAPGIKRRATQGYGARVVGYDRYTESREEIGAELARREGLTLIPPFDHPDVIAGQGTAAAELMTQVPDLDAVLTPLGGGGLLAGTALAVHAADPATRVIGVEPEVADDGRRSLEQGRIVRIDPPRTVADGVATPALGTLTFPVLREHDASVLTVSERRIGDAVRLLAGTTKLVVEPSGSLGVAALLDRPASLAGLRVGVILSGGNVDPSVLARLLTDDQDRDDQDRNEQEHDEHDPQEQETP